MPWKRCTPHIYLFKKWQPKAGLKSPSSIGSEIRALAVDSWPHDLLVVWLWASHLGPTLPWLHLCIFTGLQTRPGPSKMPLFLRLWKLHNDSQTKSLSLQKPRFPFVKMLSRTLWLFSLREITNKFSLGSLVLFLKAWHPQLTQSFYWPKVNLKFTVVREANHSGPLSYPLIEQLLSLFMYHMSQGIFYYEGKFLLSSHKSCVMCIIIIITKIYWTLINV